MFGVYKSRDTNGVLLTGDFFDFDRLYFAIMKFTGFHGREDRCVFPNCSEVCEILLSLCYELRHAWQGRRGIEQVYNGIHEYWFDDYREPVAYSYKEECDDDFDDDDCDEEDMVRFSRKDFPDVTENNTYYSTSLSFPEIVFNALILLSLLKKKDLFMQSVKKKAEVQEDFLMELNLEYFFFGAEIDIARITTFVKQILQTLYQFIGKEEYLSFINAFDQINDFSANCNLERINQLIIDYKRKEYKKDDLKSLTQTLYSFLE